MAKIKYYYKDENGNEVLARTSNNEYHYYCYGKCSKSINNVDSELKYYIKRTNEKIRMLENWDKEKHSEHAMKVWANKEKREEDLREARERLNRLHQVKIYKLYTK